MSYLNIYQLKHCDSMPNWSRISMLLPGNNLENMWNLVLQRKWELWYCYMLYIRLYMCLGLKTCTCLWSGYRDYNTDLQWEVWKNSHGFRDSFRHPLSVTVITIWCILGLTSLLWSAIFEIFLYVVWKNWGPSTSDNYYWYLCGYVSWFTLQLCRVSQTKDKTIVFCIIFFIWMTNSEIQIGSLNNTACLPAAYMPSYYITKT